MRLTSYGVGVTAVLGSWIAALPAGGVEITVTIENKAPRHGLYFTPVWVGFHDGDFDLFDPGAAILPGGGLERVAEDGATAPLMAEFAASSSGAAGGMDSTIVAPRGFAGAPVFDPGDRARATFDLDPVANRYFSFVSMVIPSNDAFFGNHNPVRFPLFDDDGEFLGPLTIVIDGSIVWDAGTEANTEMDAAFFNQTADNTGVTTADPVIPHPGFIDSVENPGGMAAILGGTSLEPPGIFFDERNADFSRCNHARCDYRLARIKITTAHHRDADDDHDEDVADEGHTTVPGSPVRPDAG